jgi:hypothetical protein
VLFLHHRISQPILHNEQQFKTFASDFSASSLFGMGTDLPTERQGQLSFIMAINYIIHHKEANSRLCETDGLHSGHISAYNALFLLWNQSGFQNEFQIIRAEVMGLAKIGSANTYTQILKDLEKNGFIKYKPSYNPLIPSKVHIYNFDKGSDKGINKGSGKGIDKGDDTINTINIETIKLINIDLLTEILKDELNNKELVRLKKDLEKLLPEKPKTEPDNLFEKFWNLYDKKKGKDKTILQWNKLKTEEKEKAIEGISFYQKYQPETKYRKDPERYLSNKVWEDEEIYKSKQLIPQQPVQGYSGAAMQSLDHLGRL